MLSVSLNKTIAPTHRYVPGHAVRADHTERHLSDAERGEDQLGREEGSHGRLPVAPDLDEVTDLLMAFLNIIKYEWMCVTTKIKQQKHRSF